MLRRQNLLDIQKLIFDIDFFSREVPQRVTVALSMDPWVYDRIPQYASQWCFNQEFNFFFVVLSKVAVDSSVFSWHLHITILYNLFKKKFFQIETYLDLELTVTRTIMLPQTLFGGIFPKNIFQVFQKCYFTFFKIYILYVWVCESLQ